MTQNDKTACILCSSPSKSLVRLRGGYEARKCSDCNVVFGIGYESRQNSEKVVDTDPEFYHGVKSSYDSQVDIALFRVQKRLEFYKEKLGRKVETVLEIGCGTGAYAGAFNSLGVKYKAIEIDPKIARFAKEKSRADIELGNFLDFIPSKEFDIVFASQVFEHVLEPDEFLKKSIETAPNGLIHFDVPNHDALVSSIRKRMSKTEYGFIQPPYHMLAYTGDVLRARFEKNNLKILLIGQFRNDHECLGQLIKASSLKKKIIYNVSGALNKGSLLTIIAKP